MRRERTRRTATVAVAIGALGLAPPAVAASSPSPSDPSPTPAATVPLAATAAFHNATLGPHEVRFAILAVARIPHGTAVYYALAPNTTGDADLYLMPSPGLGDDFAPGDFSHVDIVDTAHDALYQPLISGGDCLCSGAGDLIAPDANGTPAVGYAVLPELPADVKTVTVTLGVSVFLPGIPVGDGPPKGPTADAPVPLGYWPALPDDATVAAGDVAKATQPLTTNVADPVAATSTSPTRTSVALSSDVLFANDSATLNAKAQSALRDVAAKIDTNGTGTVTIGGYTDAVDSDAHNQALSEARARAVLAALKPLVTADVTFETMGHGEQDPIADNRTAEGRQQNRRVTVSFTTEGK